MMKMTMMIKVRVIAKPIYLALQLYHYDHVLLVEAMKLLSVLALQSSVTKETQEAMIAEAEQATKDVSVNFD